MNYLLTPIGSIGDVNPYLGIGRELVRRGHSVTVMTNPVFTATVERAGLNMVPIGSATEYHAVSQNPRVWKFGEGWKHALRWGGLGTMRPLYRAIAQRYVPGRTVVCAPGLAFGARVAQERLGVPLATLHLEPDKFRSVYRTPVMPPPLLVADWVPKISKRVQLWIADRAVIDPVIAPWVNAFRRRLGLQPVTRLVAHWWHSTDRVIGLFPPWYGPPQPDWPAQTVLTGFPLWKLETTAPVPDEVTRFLDSGPPPVVFTIGSEHCFGHDFFRAAAEACRQIGCRGVFITKHRDQIPADLPAGVRHFDYVPFSYLLPRCAALLSHGGVGTISLALAAGIPQVLVPLSFNQHDDAARVARLGVGVVLRRGHFCGNTFARALTQLVDSPDISARCQAIAARIEHANPIPETCDFLEELIGADLPARRLRVVGESVTRGTSQVTETAIRRRKAA